MFRLVAWGKAASTLSRTARSMQAIPMPLQPARAFSTTFPLLAPKPKKPHWKQPAQREEEEDDDFDTESLFKEMQKAQTRVGGKPGRDRGPQQRSPKRVDDDEDEEDEDDNHQGSVGRGHQGRPRNNRGAGFNAAPGAGPGAGRFVTGGFQQNRGYQPGGDSYRGRQFPQQFQQQQQQQQQQYPPRFNQGHFGPRHYPFKGPAPQVTRVLAVTESLAADMKVIRKVVELLANEKWPGIQLEEPKEEPQAAAEGAEEAVAVTPEVEAVEAAPAKPKKKPTKTSKAKTAKAVTNERPTNEPQLTDGDAEAKPAAADPAEGTPNETVKAPGAHVTKLD